MKKVIKYIAVIISIVMILALILIGRFIYVTEYKVTNVGTEVSEDGEYKIIFQMVGEPEWPFGATKIRIVLEKSDGTKIRRINRSIRDDGAVFREVNWEVAWQHTSVDITLKGSEQMDEVITLELQK